MLVPLETVTSTEGSAVSENLWDVIPRGFQTA
jgi:hypothetical protein